MSKMTMPEMDTVRFQENDVIVASGILFSNFENKAADGKIEVGSDEVYNAATHLDLINTYFPYSGDRYIIPKNSSSPEDRLLLTSLLDADTSSIAADRYDGYYTWDASTGIFTHQ